MSLIKISLFAMVYTHINAYDFPLFSLIGLFLCFSASENAAVTIAVPMMSPLPLLNVMATRRIQVPKKGSADALLFHSKHGFISGSCPHDLWAVRIEQPCCKQSNICQIR